MNHYYGTCANPVERVINSIKEHNRLGFVDHVCFGSMGQVSDNYFVGFNQVPPEMKAKFIESINEFFEHIKMVDLGQVGYYRYWDSFNGYTYHLEKQNKKKNSGTCNCDSCRKAREEEDKYPNISFWTLNFNPLYNRIVKQAVYPVIGELFRTFLGYGFDRVQEHHNNLLIEAWNRDQIYLDNCIRVKAELSDLKVLDFPKVMNNLFSNHNQIKSERYGWYNFLSHDSGLIYPTCTIELIQQFADKYFDN